MKVLKRWAWVSLPALVVLLVSCGDGNDSVRGVKQTFQAPELMGTWEGKCGDEPLFDLASARRIYKLEGDQILEVLELYSDGDCKDIAVQVIYEGKLELKDKSKEVPEARRIRAELNKAFMVQLTDSAAVKTGLETLQACGQTSWPKGAKHEVTASAGDANCPIGELPDLKEGLVKRDGDTLYFSAWVKGNNINDPITELDTQKAYIPSEREIKVD